MTSEFFETLMFETNLMREESFLTDFKLICDGKEFLVHKVTLSAASPYFKEHFQRNSQTTSLQMDFINSKTLDTVLMFIYQGRIDLRNASQPFLKDLLEAFIRLQITVMSNYCLEQFLGTQELLSQWDRIEQLNSDLIQQIYLEYLHKNIKTLKTTESFLNLSFEQLNALLKCPVSNPVNQEELISSILLWVKHDQATRLNRITDLLTTIDFENINYSLLLKFDDEPLLEDNLFFQKQCRKLFSNELKRKRNPETSESTVIEKRIRSETKFPNLDQRRSSVSKRFLVYQYLINNIVLEYNPNSETLTEVEDQILVHFFSLKSRGTAVCGFDNFVYIFGGKFNSKITKNCFMLDLLQKKIQPVNPMTKTLNNLMAVKLHEFIYVVGSKDRLSYCERFNVITHQWKSRANNPYAYRLDCNILFSVDDRLCLIGLTHLLWYNPQTDQWSQGVPLPDDFRIAGYPSATYVNGKIFLVHSPLRNVYSFDLKMKIWNTFSCPEHVFNCPGRVLNCFSSITCLKKFDSTEFLIGAELESLIFKPPNNWRSISANLHLDPRIISIQNKRNNYNFG